MSGGQDKMILLSSYFHLIWFEFVANLAEIWRLSYFWLRQISNLGQSLDMVLRREH